MSDAANFVLSCKSVLLAFIEAVNLYRVYGQRDRTHFEQSIGAGILAEERNKLIEVFSLEGNQRGQLAELLVRKIDRQAYFNICSSELKCHRDVKIYDGKANVLCSGKNYDNCHFKACSEVKKIDGKRLCLIKDEAAFVEIKFDIAKSSTDQKYLWLTTLQEYGVEKKVRVILFSLGEDTQRGNLYLRYPELNEEKYRGKFDYFEGQLLVSMLPIRKD